MIKKPKHSNLFYKYLVSYIVILLIPLLVMSIIIYNYYDDTLKKELLKNNFNKLTQIKNNIDMQMNQLDKIIVQLYSSEKLQPYYIKSDILNIINTRDILSKYDLTNDFTDEIILYIYGEKMIYSSTSTYTWDSFLDYIYHYINWNKEDFLDTINNIKNRKLYPAKDILVTEGSIRRYLTYISPLPVDNSKTYGTVLFLINEKNVHHFISDLFNNKNSNTIILNKEGNIITATSYKNYLTSPEFKEIVSNIDGKYIDNIILYNKEYLVSSTVSTKNNWKYINLVPTRQVLQPLNDINIKYIYGILLIVIIGGLVIYLLMIYNYNPIKKLKQFTEKNWSNVDNDSGELQMIKSAITDLSSKSKLLEQKVNNSRTAVKEYLLHNVLKGNINNIKQFNESGKELGICFTNNSYRIAIFSINKSDKYPVDNKILIKEIEKKIPEELEGYGKDSFTKNKIIFVLSLDIENNFSLESQLLYLQQYFAKKYQLEITIGVGNSYHEFGSLGKSYIEAATALDYKLVKGEGKVIFFNEVISNNSNFNYYPAKEIKKLELAILQGDTASISHIITNIINIIHENNTTLFMARCLSFDIIKTVLKTTNEIKDKVEKNEINYPDVLTLTEFNTFEELAELVQNICSDICSYLHTSKKDNDLYLMERIYDYIKEHFDEYNFSVQNMADHFGMHSSNLSHFFKEQTNHTISDYVTNLRIERAKELLKTSDKPVKDIIKKIGYYDPSSFTKKFKQYVGTTPGKFRKLYR